MNGSDAPYPLPEGWTWQTLGAICTKPQYGFTAKAVAGGDGPKFLRTTDLSESGVDWDTVPYCSQPPENEDKYALQDGDIVVARAGSVGKAEVLRNPPRAVFGSYLIRFKATRADPAYLGFFLRSPVYWDQIREASAGIAIPNVNASKLSALQVPCPPLPEQHRLVEKIERLLEQSRTAREALDRIPPLLKRFRQAVLAKAFRGELTERDPNDEPASVLLERIREERRRKWEEDLRTRGKDPRKAKYVEPEPPDTSGLPELPEGWAWATVGLVTANYDGMRIPIKQSRRKEMQGPYPYYGASGIIDHVGDFIFEGDFLLVGEDGANLLNRASPIAFRASGRFWVNNHAHVLQTLGDIPLLFLEYFFGSIQLAPYVTGTAQPKMTQANMNLIPLPLAPAAEQRRLVNWIRTSLTRAAEVETGVTSARQQCSDLDQGVLMHAFRGERSLPRIRPQA